MWIQCGLCTSIGTIPQAVKANATFYWDRECRSTSSVYIACLAGRPPLELAARAMGTNTASQSKSLKQAKIGLESPGFSSTFW
jgi:hypothetical protein